MFPKIELFSGWITLYTYSLLVNLGVAIGLAWLYVRAPAEKRSRWLDAGIAATVGGLIGARLLYVIVNGAYYGANLAEALMIWRGGLAWPGAAVGGLAALWFYTRRTREPLLPIIDALALPLAILGLLTWSGCLAAGCAYGVEVAPGQLPAGLVSTAPDLYGLSVPRWPTQAAGIGWSLIVIALVFSMRDRRWPAGAHGCYALSLIALGAFALSFTRGDPLPLLGSYRLDTVGNALVLVAATLAWSLLLMRQQVPLISEQ
jgi:phosphatidylglycerol:prolipoprotein diacylglycerol transferase